MPGIGESKTSARRVAAAQRRAEAVKMRRDGARYSEIAKKLGYTTPASAVQDVQRALSAEIAEPAAELRAIEVQRLDMMWQATIEVLRAQHVVVSNGRVVFLNDEPIKDHGPILAAIDRLLKIQERRARLLGLDAPKSIEVVSIDAVDAEIRRLNAELHAAEEAARLADELDRAETGPVGGAPPAES